MREKTYLTRSVQAGRCLGRLCAARRRLALLMGILGLVLSVSGCSGSPIAQDLTQNQANEIVAVLNNSGISAVAQRESGSKGKFSVEVRRADYSQSVTILHERRLPSEARATFSELVSPSGLLPNSREMDALRVDRALATEIEDLLSVHPNVFRARVIVRSHFLKEAIEPGVSIVIQERIGRGIPEKEVRDVVAKVLPGVKDTDIVLSIYPALAEQHTSFSAEGAVQAGGAVVRVPLTPFLFFWRVPEDEYVQIVAVIAGFLVLVAVVAAIVGYWYSLYQHSREYFESSLPDLMSPRAQGRLPRPKTESNQDLEEP